jgi:hypothetical protein
MSNPIQVLAQLSLTESGVNISLPTISAPISVAFSGSRYTQNVMSVPTTSGGTAIPLGNLGNLGLAMFINLDPTNPVTLMTAVSGTNIIKLLPGDYALFRFAAAVTAPAAISATSPCLLEYLILEN